MIIPKLLTKHFTSHYQHKCVRYVEGSTYGFLNIHASDEYKIFPWETSSDEKIIESEFYLLYTDYTEIGRMLLVTRQEPWLGCAVYYLRDKQAFISLTSLQITDENLQDHVNAIQYIIEQLRKERCVEVILDTTSTGYYASRPYNPVYNFDLYYLMEHGTTWYAKELGFELGMSDEYNHEIKYYKKEVQSLLQHPKLSCFQEYTIEASEEIRNKTNFFNPCHYHWTKPLSETNLNY